MIFLLFPFTSRDRERGKKLRASNTKLLRSRSSRTEFDYLAQITPTMYETKSKGHKGMRGPITRLYLTLYL